MIAWSNCVERLILDSLTEISIASGNKHRRKNRWLFGDRRKKDATTFLSSNLDENLLILFHSFYVLEKINQSST